MNVLRRSDHKQEILDYLGDGTEDPSTLFIIYLKSALKPPMCDNEIDLFMKSIGATVNMLKERAEVNRLLIFSACFLNMNRSICSMLPGHIGFSLRQS